MQRSHEQPFLFGSGLSRLNPLPDQLTLVVLAHFVGFGGQYEAVPIQNKMSNSILATFTRIQGLPNVVSNVCVCKVEGPRPAVRVISVECLGFFGRACGDGLLT